MNSIENILLQIFVANFDMHPEHKCHVLCQCQCSPHAPKKPQDSHDLLSVRLHRHQLQCLWLCTRVQLHMQSHVVLHAIAASLSAPHWFPEYVVCRFQLLSADHLQTTLSSIQTNNAVRSVWHSLVHHQPARFSTVFFRST